jgi:CMP-N-acetylneuraminic acid synthetase
MPYVGFIPCRAGSERVPGKNTRPFAGFENGILELKLRQLSQVPELERIIVSTNDEKVADYTASYAKAHDARVEVLPRPDYLGRSSTSMGEFILYIADLVADGTIMWTHVTSPFVTARHYQAGIRAYEAGLAQGYDCLVSATKIHKFIWDDKGPVNYDNTVEKWPRSQDIKPLYEINHAMYIMPFALMREMQDRIGRRPLFHAMEEQDALDIDWEPQFQLLEQMALVKKAKGESLL